MMFLPGKSSPPILLRDAGLASPGPYPGGRLTTSITRAENIPHPLQNPAPVSTVGEDDLHPGKTARQGRQQRSRAISVLNAGAVNEEADNESEDVSDNVTFASVHLLSSVEAVNN